MDTREPSGTQEARRPLRADGARLTRINAQECAPSPRPPADLYEDERAFARGLPLEKIPALVALLAERLLRARETGPSNQTPQPERLLTASEMAERLSVPESWIRTEERAGRIPGIRIGRYVRFRASEVEAALRARGGQ